MLSGIINVLKPPGMTSHDVVAYIRRIYNIKKVGHAGTLDPAAAGVLPIFIGQATRLIEYAVNADKSYRVEVSWGYETDTGDDTGKIVCSAACIPPDCRQLDEVLKLFIGINEQLPPMYSAVKVNGKRLYELAREGLHVERSPRTIVIHNIALIKSTDKRAVFDVTCSKGTYIRTLCMDIGRTIGCPAVMSFLVRTRVGIFSLAEAWTIEEVAADKLAVMLPPDYAVSHLPKLILSVEQAKLLSYGQQVSYHGPHYPVIRVYDCLGRFAGIASNPAGTDFILPLKNMSSD